MQSQRIAWVPDPERYWAKVDVRGPDECWPWTGAKYKPGYGLMRSRRHGVLRATHIAMYFDGREIPPGMSALHHCDNPPCVNPRHLYAGTHLDNARDCKERGLFPDRSGERNGRALLTASDVVAIRVAYAAGAGPTELAKRYGLRCASHICDIARGRKWPSAGGPIAHELKPGQDRPPPAQLAAPAE